LARETRFSSFFFFGWTSKMGDSDSDSQSDDFKANLPVVSIDKKSKKQTSNAKPGVVYLGRIPHGFYEEEMHSYFSQFGKVLQLRLSRNKKVSSTDLDW
jgi:nucleolar protein 15